MKHVGYFLFGILIFPLVISGLLLLPFFGFYFLGKDLLNPVYTRHYTK